MRFPSRALLMLAIAALVVLAGGCGSSSKSASSSSTTTGAGNAADSSCPFSGSTSSQTTPAGPVPSVVLESVSPRRAGCIDQVQFNFKPAVVGSQASYSGTTLNVKLMGATLGSGLNGVGSTVVPKGLAYVKSVTVTATPSGEIDWQFALDKVRPFLVSSAGAPPYIQVAIG